MSKTNETAQSRLEDSRVAEIETITKQVFDQVPTRVAFPGGTSRDTFITEISGKLYVLAKREEEKDAQLEAIVLKTLSPCGYVPQFIARSGRWLIQQCLPGPRIPVTMDAIQDMTQRSELMERTINSLISVRDFAHSENLQYRVPKIGGHKDWPMRRINEAAKVSRMLDISLPDIDPKFLQAHYQTKFNDFVKWDSRPGNALQFEDRIYWFDWEDCGRRNAMDDFICLIMDEWNMIDTQSEQRLIDQYISKFAGSMSETRTREYFAIASFIHISFRLRLAIGYKNERGEWWDRDKCLASDKVGVTPEETTRLLYRLVELTSDFKPLSKCRKWVDDIAIKLDLQPFD